MGHLVGRCCVRAPPHALPPAQAPLQPMSPSCDPLGKLIDEDCLMGATSGVLGKRMIRSCWFIIFLRHLDIACGAKACPRAGEEMGESAACQ